MMIFTSVYSIVDGLFVSNFAGKTPFSAINLIMPVLMVLGSVGFMVGTGGSAIVAKTLGEKWDEEVNEYFSLLVYFTFVFFAYTVGLDGVWSAVIVAELGSLILTVIFMLKNGARYGYSAQKKAKN